MPDKNWQFELEEYIRQGEPERAEKSEAWKTAIGLQAVDGLKTSKYLLDTVSITMRSMRTLGISVTRWFEQIIMICKKVFIPPQSFWNCFSQTLCSVQTTN